MNTRFFHPLRRPAAVLFDWDDTLSHHRDISARLMAELYVSMGANNETITGRELLLAWYKNPEASCARYYPNASVEEIRQEYRKKLNALPLEDTTLLPHAEEVLQALKKKGIPMAIVSNKSQDRLLQEIRMLGVEDFFQVICGYDQQSADRGKPHPDPIIKVLKAMRLPLQDIWFVGDAPEDAEAARSDGVQRFHIGDFLRDLVHERVEPNDSAGKIIFLPDLESFLNRCIKSIPKISAGALLS